MVDFSLSDEERQIRDTVRSFIEKEVMPLEPEVLRNERAGRPGLELGTLRELQNKARRSGFWGVNTPEEYGGMDLGAVMSAIVAMECGNNSSMNGDADRPSAARPPRPRATTHQASA
jgi:acyl-CoA dehydrogenase